MSYVDNGSIITLHSAGKDQRRDKTPKVIDFTLEEQKEITENPGPSRPNQTEQPSTGMTKKINFNFHGGAAGTRERMGRKRDQQHGGPGRRRDEDMRTRKDGKRRY